MSAIEDDFWIKNNEGMESDWNDPTLSMLGWMSIAIATDPTIEHDTLVYLVLLEEFHKKHSRCVFKIAYMHRFTLETEAIVTPHRTPYLEKRADNLVRNLEECLRNSFPGPVDGAK